MTLFTGSQPVADLLTRELQGKVNTRTAFANEGYLTMAAQKVKLEDAGFDWKILGPDVHDTDYVAWQCDQV